MSLHANSLLFLFPSLCMSHPLPFTASLIHICTQALPSTSSLHSLQVRRKREAQEWGRRRWWWEAGRRSTAAACCWQEENAPVISQHRYRQKNLGRRKEKKRKRKKEQSSENKPPARLNSPEARPGHDGVQSGNKGRRGELGIRWEAEEWAHDSTCRDGESDCVCASMCVWTCRHYFLVIVYAS